MKRKYFFLIGIIAILLLVNPAYAQENAQEDRLEDFLEEDKGRALTPAEELIEMLKKRALRKIESERKKQLWATKGTIGLHMAYDNNVNVSATRDGDSYFEQYFSFSWIPTFSDYLAAEVGTWYFGDWYFENKDTTLFDNAFNASLKWYPRGDPTFELQPGVERCYAYYIKAEDSTYVEDKAFLKFKHRFWKRWSQDGKYEYSFKEYDTKHPRTGPGSTTYVMGSVLEKNRHTVEYNLGFPLGKNNLKLKNKAYVETSNDGYQDYYDVYSHKVTGEVGRSLTKKLYSKFSSAYERKNYRGRQVAEYSVAEYDDVYTNKIDFYYTLKKGWTLSCTIQHKKSDSNNAVSDYDSMSYKTGVYISF